MLPLHYAAWRKETALLEALIAAHPEGAAAADEAGWLPLHYACFARAAPPLVEVLPSILQRCHSTLLGLEESRGYHDRFVK